MSRLPAILLAPIVLVQARRVRRETPQLPDAAGARTGGSGPLRLLVIGDSTAVGMGAPTLDDALPGRLAHELGGASWRAVGRSGWTSAEVLRDFGDEAAVESDIAVVLVGWNDALQLRSARAFGRDLGALLSRVNARRTVVVGPPRFGDFAVFPQPLRWAVGAQAHGIGRAAARVAERHGAVLAAGFDGGSTALDRFHPDAAGYAAMAAAIRAVLA